MPAVTLSEMLALEDEAISSGWSEEQLLDQAGMQLGIAIGRHFPRVGMVIAYLGKGHNAGDAVVALGVLKKKFGWKIAIRHAFPPGDWSPLLARKISQLGTEAEWLDRLPEWRSMASPFILLDGLLGCGGKGPLRGTVAELAREMEWLRQNAGARVASVDLPSGVDADTGMAMAGAVTADVTFMIAHAKHGLLLGNAANHTGALALVAVEALNSNPGPFQSDLELISPQTMDFGKTPRLFDFHKGMAGRVSVIAGSLQYPGAAVLAATGALRGGGGLVTLYVPEPAYPTIAAKSPAEIIVRTYRNFSELKACPCDAWVIGCGLGQLSGDAAIELMELISHHPAPAVLDADALNTIAANGTIHVVQSRHIITPHPGEFRRLAPHLEGMDREQAVRKFVSQHSATLLLKGSRTLIARRNSPVWCNSTGTPAMAGGGQGDLLSGVIGASLARGMPPMEAAAYSAWICGRAAENTLNLGEESEESLTPGDVARNLGRAFKDWRCSLR
jgi:hydroxyethylthiazole kinase-like uncharacterized protein yjeF